MPESAKYLNYFYHQLKSFFMLNSKLKVLPPPDVTNYTTDNLFRWYGQKNCERFITTFSKIGFTRPVKVLQPIGIRMNVSYYLKRKV